MDRFILFLFNEPYEIREPYPETFATHFFPTDFLGLYKGTPADEYKLFDGTTWTPKQYYNFFDSYIEHIDNLTDYIYNLANFADETKMADGLRAANMIFTFNRIMAECCVILTTHRVPIISTAFAFGVIDKIANLVQQMRHPEKINEAKLFKMLVSKNKLSKLQFLYNKYPSPFDNYLRNRLKSALDDIESKVIESIFLKNRISKSKIILDPADPSNSLSKDQYIQEVLRCLRNTSHGYGIQKNCLEKLILSDCSIGKGLEFLVPLLVLMLIASPIEFIDKLLE